MKSMAQKYRKIDLSKRIVVISGPPGVGKTEAIKRACLMLPRAAHISIDKLRKFVRAVYASPDNWNKSVEQQYKLAYKNAVDLIKNFSKKGYLVFVDDVFQNRWKLSFQKQLVGHKTYFIFLSSKPQVVLKRNGLRKEYAVKKNVVESLYRKLKKENTESHGWKIIDSNNLSIQETAEEILRVIGF